MSLIVGHRGCGTDGFGSSRRGIPRENTLLSFLKAGRDGADLVEFDVQLTADGVPVIFHDWSVRVPLPSSASHALSSIPPIRVPVGQLTLAQLGALHWPQPLLGRGTEDEGSTRAAALAARARQPSHSGSVLTSASAEAYRVAASEGRRLRANMRRCDALGLDLQRVASTSDVLASTTEHTARAQATLHQDFSLGLWDRFCTLSDVLKTLQSNISCNIELKYPSDQEAAHYGLRPPDREEYCTTVLGVVQAHARPLDGSTAAPRPSNVASSAGPSAAQRVVDGGQQGRTVICSCFDPDTCLAMLRAMKQLGVVYPVYFLTEGGTHASGSVTDPRMASLEAAVEFASTHGLQGVVTHAPAILKDPQAWQDRCKALGLVLATYGRANNDPAHVRAQAVAGVPVIIVDDVPGARKAVDGLGVGVK